MSADEITWGGPVPVYQQVADILRARIESGQIEVGKAIPSKAAIMQEFEVGEKTAGHAVTVLKDEGLVRTSHGLGNFVVRKP